MGIVAFSVGGVDFYWYGCVWMAAVSAGLLLTWLHLYLRGEPLAPLVDMLLWGLPAGMVFARIVYVWLHLSVYQSDWTGVFRIWQGGFSIYGSMLGFIFTVFLFCRCRRLDPWYWLDIMAPAIIAGLALNQLGNFVAQTVVGMPMPLDMPNDHTLAEYIEYRYRPSGFENYEYFKPVALYQAALQGLIFVAASLLSYRRIRQRQFPTGTVFLGSMIVISLARFAFGFMYLSASKAVGLHFGQMVCLAAAVSLSVAFFMRWRQQKDRLYV